MDKKDNTLPKELTLDDETKKSKRGEVILGRLYGPCADIIHATRNGRRYPEKVWEKVFNSEIINEFFESGGLLGELDHPEDRVETCTEKVAICMPEKPFKDKEGHLIAYFDILDTPNGRIAYTLAKYGYKLGISSRGDGEVFENLNGEEEVDADKFDLKGFDLVLLPAVKAARLKMIESMQKSFSTALTEALSKSNADERKVQEETLKHLGIDYGKVPVEDNNTSADNIGDDVLNQLQESLRANRALEAKIKTLQESLSVCYAKENEYRDKLSKYQKAVINLTESAKKAKVLEKQLGRLNEDLQKAHATVEIQTRTIKTLKENLDTSKTTLSSLNEKLNSQHNTVNGLQESLRQTKDEKDARIKSLQEELTDVRKDLELKDLKNTEQLRKTTQMVEQYRKIAKVAVNRYIESKSRTLGISPEVIKSKLGEKYSFNEIDKICENLQTYQLNISQLPFNVVSDTSKLRAKLKESSKPVLKSTGSEIDDEVDPALMRMACIEETKE